MEFRTKAVQLVNRQKIQTNGWPLYSPLSLVVNFQVVEVIAHGGVTPGCVL